MAASLRVTVMVPEMKCEFDLYEYVRYRDWHEQSTYFSPQVRTYYVPFSMSTYLVHTDMYCVYKNIALDAVLCCMPVGNDTMCA